MTFTENPVLRGLFKDISTSTRIRFIAHLIYVLVSCLGVCSRASAQAGTPAPLTITANGDGNGILFLNDVGVSYDTLFAAAGGAPPYTYSVVAGQLPAGETLSAT